MLTQTVSSAATIILVLAGASLAGALPASAAWSAKMGITEARAKHEIIGDGYTKVQNLHKSTNGWTATALEGGKPVTVLVNDRGDVEKTK
jgi:hypothetical protein